MTNCECDEGLKTAQGAAAELFQLAAILCGDERQAAEVAEDAIVRSTIDPCADAAASLKAAQRHLAESAVARLSKQYPGAFAAPSTEESPTGCIDTDDLTDAGLSAAELAQMLAGPSRGLLREWLDKLPVAQRAIFVFRAILGWDNAAVAAFLNESLRQHWQPSQVSTTFRQALCSLASSLSRAAAN